MVETAENFQSVYLACLETCPYLINKQHYDYKNQIAFCIYK